jgi:hypothetical protein
MQQVHPYLYADKSLQGREASRAHPCAGCVLRFIQRSLNIVVPIGAEVLLYEWRGRRLDSMERGWGRCSRLRSRRVCQG